MPRSRGLCGPCWNLIVSGTVQGEGRDVSRTPTMTGLDREYLFGAFRLNVSTRQLWQATQEVTLPLKAFECLVYLIENRARAVSRSELFQTVWRNVHLTENVLDQTIFVLRRTLDDTTPGSTHIKTVRGFGYHWVAPVETETAQESTVLPSVHADVPRARLSKQWQWGYGASSSCPFCSSWPSCFRSTCAGVGNTRQTTINGRMVRRSPWYCPRTSVPEANRGFATVRWVSSPNGCAPPDCRWCRVKPSLR